MSLARMGKFVDLAPDVISGDHCKVWSFAIICRGVRMGHRCVIGSKVYIGRHATLGDDVHLQDGAFLVDHIHVGHRVFIGVRVTTADDRHPKVNHPEYQAEPPIIEDDVAIGNAACILPGVRLGRGCTVGAGAVVTKDVPAGETWVGNPAHPLMARPTSGMMDDLGIDWDLYLRLCGCRCREEAGDVQGDN